MSEINCSLETYAGIIFRLALYSDEVYSMLDNGVKLGMHNITNNIPTAFCIIQHIVILLFYFYSLDKKCSSVVVRVVFVHVVESGDGGDVRGGVRSL